MKKQIDFQQIAKIAGVLLIGLFLGWLFFGGSTEQPSSTQEHVEQAHTDTEGNIVYTCSMHPNVRESEPGNCPICGMELIPVNSASSDGEESPYELTMTQAAMKLAEVQTTRVVTEEAINSIRMPGKVVVDERRISNVTAHFPGRIKELYVDFTGERVQEGERLASIYSPQLLTAQRELLETSKHKEQNPALYEATRRKLKLWELPEEEINRIENSGEVMTDIDIVSPAEGYVLNRNISTEDHVMEGTVMYKIANLSKVWVVFNAYESDLAGIDVGDDVSFNVDAYPGETFNAQVTYIDPVLDPQSRTANVRAEAVNNDRRLKPQMLAEGIISSNISRGEGQLLVPKSAVLWTGERSVIYVKKPNTEQPTFEFREVVLGQRVGDRYVVKSGVSEGEEVVTNGNFKIDSAAQLSGKASMMNREPDGRKPARHDHGSMEMNNGQMKSTQEPKTEKSDTTEHRHISHLDNLLNEYQNMKEALADDRLDEAKKYLHSFRQEAVQSSQMTDHSAHANTHEDHHSAMLASIKEAENAQNAESFRRAFAGISEHLTKAVQNQGYNEQSLFLQYCPMAIDGEGATWLSTTPKIKNPYMGQKMPGCGETKTEI
ncbi:efflux RND transporter periplasmic adaptor subunit [Balneolaceae bacterium YR4-1]|uniref:Efflux RND transporter periplasmic adaptor subunit n=1 Tax=Halalkalibaculum roseum TaxID=2709311 RepID=A0A6M1STU0_9BACT|nr:efflux RND transporter periplasmic adaptor subunit [Halalkalibaculum roseum]NGP75518.1 efflux RND transporter periplasmic adaptor subunit [Halalkalibaculum roseum]